MHELEIINCVGLQQEAAIKPFIREMLHRSVDGQDTLFHNGISWGNRIKELQRQAQLTYTAVRGSELYYVSDTNFNSYKFS
jgi:hypothetical protein